MYESTVSGNQPDPERAEDRNPSGDSEPVPGPADEMRLLRRSRGDRVIGGVCGGLGRYFGADPVLFRLAFLLLLAPGGIGILIYLGAWIAIPEFKSVEDEERDRYRAPMNRRTAGLVVGSALILLGAVILTYRFIDWVDPRIVGGAALVAIGVWVVIRGLKSEARA